VKEREYLVELGLAKPGRGRYSADAKRALRAAEHEGIMFDVPVIAQARAPREPKPTRHVPERDSYSPKAVREWAADEGIHVGARGRIDADIVSQYLKSQTDEVVRAAIRQETNADPSIILELQARTYPEGSQWVPVDDKDNRRAIGDANVCMPCGVSLGWHKCNAPMALVKGERDYVSVRLVV